MLKFAARSAIGAAGLYGSYRFGEWVQPIIIRKAMARGYGLGVSVGVGAVVCFVGGILIGQTTSKIIRRV